MGKVKIYADFNNADTMGRLRLICKGTTDDLKEQATELQEGQVFVFSDGELETEGIVTYSQTEKIWVAVTNWSKIKS